MIQKYKCKYLNMGVSKTTIENVSPPRQNCQKHKSKHGYHVMSADNIFI